MYKNINKLYYLKHISIIFLYNVVIFFFSIKIIILYTLKVLYKNKYIFLRLYKIKKY